VSRRIYAESRFSVEKRRLGNRKNQKSGTGYRVP
jgi:hypothetical protein